jgi:general nucleoside transport system permease protein
VRGERGASRFSLSSPAPRLLLGVVVSVALLALLLKLFGYDASRALGALWRGSLGSSYAILSATLVRATPLIIAGLAVALAFQAGILNIGAEGQLLAGAAVAAAIGVCLGESLGRATLVIMLIGGAVFGALWAGIAAELRRRFGVLEVISTIMLNFIALHAVSYLVRGPLQEPTHIYPQTADLPLAARLPRLWPGTRLHAGFIFGVGLATGLWWWLRSTAAGFRLRATGMNSFAARTAVLIDTSGVTTAAFLISGALAGLAGAVELSGVTYALYENLSPGYGYTAIAVALLARLRPLMVVAAGILFGALEAGAGAMQRDADVPAVLVSVVEALVILGILAADRVSRSAAEQRA